MTLTVKDLLKACEEQIRLGNGDKFVLLSDDDEGNGFHPLFYDITDDPERVDDFIKDDCHCKGFSSGNAVLLG